MGLWEYLMLGGVGWGVNLGGRGFNLALFNHWKVAFNLGSRSVHGRMAVGFG